MQTRELNVPIGTIIGISMILAGVILTGVVIWRAFIYRSRQRDSQRGLDS